jgi:hypothetical protein
MAYITINTYGDNVYIYGGVSKRPGGKKHPKRMTKYF